jgi:hypothetical protein
MTIEPWMLLLGLGLIIYGLIHIQTQLERMRAESFSQLSELDFKLEQKLDEMRFELETKIDEVENTIVDPQWRKGEFDPILGCRPGDYRPIGDKDE